MSIKSDSIANKLKGKANQAVGAAREKAGDLVGNESMEAKGRAQHAKGDAQEATGKLEGEIAVASDKVKDALKS